MYVLKGPAAYGCSSPRPANSLNLTPTSSRFCLSHGSHLMHKICSPHLHLITSHGTSSSLCRCHLSHGLHCLGTDLTGRREWRHHRHTFRKAGIQRATHCDEDTPTAETRERGHWGYWHGHAHINDTFAQDFTHSHSRQIKAFKALWQWQPGKIYHSLPMQLPESQSNTISRFLFIV